MTYRSVPDSEIAVEKLITNQLMTALRDNPTAIANGDAGAPKIKNAAFDAREISAQKLKDGEVWGEKFLNATAGDYIEVDIEKTYSTTTTYAKYIEVFAPRDGVVKVSINTTAYIGGFSRTIFSRIYVNGVAVGAEYSAGTGDNISYTENITVSAGDFIQIYNKYSGFDYDFTTNVKISTANPIGLSWARHKDY